MKPARWIPILFALAALYDGVIGCAFLFAPEAVFGWFKVTPPNHPGYIQFPAGLLLVFALLFAAVARAPARNRNLIPYGMMLKVCYCGVAGYHWLAAGIPCMWKPFVIADIVFLVAFGWAWSALGQAINPPATRHDP